MNREQIEQTVMKALARIAPEVDAGTMDPDKSFRDQFDFDSMDYLTLMLDLDKALGIHISEIDYPKLSSLSGCVQYLDAKLDAAAGKT
ncbi:MAG: acyl carrier protein [Arenicellales bacterium]|jgi:acyl carrier protein